MKKIILFFTSLFTSLLMFSQSTTKGYEQYNFYIGIVVIGGKESPYVRENPYVIKEYKNNRRIVATRSYPNGTSTTETCYFSKSDSKGSYFTVNNNGTIIEWFITNNHKFASRRTGNIEMCMLYPTYQEAKGAGDGVRMYNMYSGSNSSSNTQNNSTVTNSRVDKKKGCTMCEIPGGEGYEGNGRCRTCMGSGRYRVLGEYTICPSCQVKYETHGNGVCQWCKGTGWRK